MTVLNKPKRYMKLIKCLRVLSDVLFWGLMLFLTAVFVYLVLTLTNQEHVPKLGAFFSDAPEELGKVTTLKTSEKIDKRYLHEEINVPYDYLNENELLSLFFSESNEEGLEEKHSLLRELIPYDSNEKIQKGMKVFQLIPNELLSLMKKDGLEITLADIPPLVQKESDLITAGTYKRKDNRIIIYNSNYNLSTIIHEIGHWIESYLKRNVDYFVLDRIGEEMKQEFQFLGLDDFGQNYATSDQYEMFATIFEHYILDYEKLRTNAPISHDYMTYYLERLLI